jgi:hypothetical protein
MESEESQIVPRFFVEPLVQLRIEGFSGLLWSDGGIPLGSDILDLQLVGSARKESTNEKEFLIPNWGVALTVCSWRNDMNSPATFLSL